MQIVIEGGGVGTTSILNGNESRTSSVISNTDVWKAEQKFLLDEKAQVLLENLDFHKNCSEGGILFHSIPNGCTEDPFGKTLYRVPGFSADVF